MATLKVAKQSFLWHPVRCVYKSQNILKKLTCVKSKNEIKWQVTNGPKTLLKSSKKYINLFQQVLTIISYNLHKCPPLWLTLTLSCTVPYIYQQYPSGQPGSK